MLIWFGKYIPVGSICGLWCGNFQISTGSWNELGTFLLSYQLLLSTIEKRALICLLMWKFGLWLARDVPKPGNLGLLCVAQVRAWLPRHSWPVSFGCWEAKMALWLHFLCWRNIGIRLEICQCFQCSLGASSLWSNTTCLSCPAFWWHATVGAVGWDKGGTFVSVSRRYQRCLTVGWWDLS